MAPLVSDRVLNRLRETLRPVRELIRRNIERQNLSVSADDILGVLITSCVMNDGITLAVDELLSRKESRMMDHYKLLARYLNKRAIRELLHWARTPPVWLVSKSLSGLEYKEVIDAVNQTLDLQFELASRANLIGRRVYLIMDQHEVEAWHKVNVDILVPINPKKKRIIGGIDSIHALSAQRNSG
ncbi:MAG TPA: hypothetical protein ENG21_03415 [Nitrososphaeria archaeon]|nr:hypothetical protein [Nitrososphaeria archaeon]